MWVEEAVSELSNIRRIVGWLIGRTIIDVTAEDPVGIPDRDPEDDDLVTLHLDNGGTLTFRGGDGFWHRNPDWNKPGGSE